MNIVTDIAVIRPELFVAVAGMVMLMFGAFRGESSARFMYWLAIGVFVVAGVLVLAGPAGTSVAFNAQFVVDDFAVFAKILLLVGAALALVLAMPFNLREGIDQFEFPILIVFAVLGMMMMVSANDLMSLYLGIERKASRSTWSPRSVAIRCAHPKQASNISFWAH